MILKLLNVFSLSLSFSAPPQVIVDISFLLFNEELQEDFKCDASSIGRASHSTARNRENGSQLKKFNCKHVANSTNT